jgi:hypothetical protein
MKIPKQVKIGRNKWHIKRVHTMPRKGHSGEADFLRRVLTVATHSKATGAKYPEAIASEVFWHELTHAILYDMNTTLTYNEKFVTAFAKRLNQAINTAVL